jgi:hypothetical protein
VTAFPEKTLLEEAEEELVMTCCLCFDVGYVLEAKLKHNPTQLELMPCFYPDCENSGRPVDLLCLYGEWKNPALHPKTGNIMSVEHAPQPPVPRYPELIVRQ